jgi:uncharacterized protein
MRELFTTVGIGLVSGLLSGAFGIGGGIITTPGIRLLLGAPALVAVGTPLPVIIPSAITGSWNYYRRGSLDVRTGLWCGIFGSAFAVLGALATQNVGRLFHADSGSIVLLATAALILYTAVDMILQVIRPPRLGLEAAEERDAFAPDDTSDAERETAAHARAAAYGMSAYGMAPVAPVEPAKPVAPLWKLAAIGGLTGLYSGFLGLGGGFVLVPLLTRWLGFDIKRAIGTSLMAIAILAVPGTITHAFLGHVDWMLAAALAVGVIPGAWIGSRMTLGSSDRGIRIAFAGMLVAVGGWLAIAEIVGLGR